MTPFNLLGIADPPCEEYRAAPFAEPQLCPHFERCRDERMACAAFQIYVEHSKIKGAREPSRRWFTNIYGGDA